MPHDIMCGGALSKAGSFKSETQMVAGSPSIIGKGSAMGSLCVSGHVPSASAWVKRTLTSTIKISAAANAMLLAPPQETDAPEKGMLSISSSVSRRD